MIEHLLNKIHCAEAVGFMREHMPDECIDLTVTSPPYDDLRTYEGYTFDYKAMLSELYRVTKQGGVVVWVVGDATINGSETGTSFRQALYAMEIGFNLHDTMIWNKPNPVPQFKGGKRYTLAFEYMFVLSKQMPCTFNCITVPTTTAGIGTNRDKKSAFVAQSADRRRDVITVAKATKPLTNVWQYVAGGEQAEHPAIFPERLASDHIRSWSNEGDVVFDPMCGSGTTCKAAKYLLRRYIGIDISEKYCEIARKRLQQMMLC